MGSSTSAQKDEGRHFRNSVRTSIIRRQIVKRTIFWSLLIVSLIGLLDYSTTGWGEENIAAQEFSYPYNVPNFSQVVDQYRFRSKITLHHVERMLEQKPLNLLYSSVPFLTTAVHPKDNMPHGIIIIVKSAIYNVEKREGIRQTWGQAGYLSKSQLSPNLPTKLVFICGVPANFKDSSQPLKEIFPHEWKYNDIIIADFIDQYSNNTYKSVLALKWAVEEFPSEFQYLFLVDDDMYVDLSNLVEYMQNFPKRHFIKNYYENSGFDFPFYRHTTIFNKNYSVTSGQEIVNQGLYLGIVYPDSRPMRGTRFWHPGRPDWHVTLDHYPYNYYPPYVPGAAITFSKEAVHKMYYATLYVKPFSIDDVYFGIIAKKLGIIPVTSDLFYAWYPTASIDIEKDRFSEAIAIHGCQCTAQMIDLWMNRNSHKLLSCP